MKWQFYHAADSLSLLPLNSSLCHCRSPFITITKTLQHLNLIHSPIPIPIHHHHHHPWILLPKVTGETLVFVSSILPKRSTIYLSLSLSLSLSRSLSVLYMGFYTYVLNWLASFSFFLGCGRFFQLQGWIYPVLGKCPRYFFFLFWFYIEVL